MDSHNEKKMESSNIFKFQNLLLIKHIFLQKTYYLSYPYNKYSTLNFIFVLRKVNFSCANHQTESALHLMLKSNYIFQHLNEKE